MRAKKDNLEWKEKATRSNFSVYLDPVNLEEAARVFKSQIHFGRFGSGALTIFGAIGMSWGMPNAFWPSIIGLSALATNEVICRVLRDKKTGIIPGRKGEILQTAGEMTRLVQDHVPKIAVGVAPLAALSTSISLDPSKGIALSNPTIALSVVAGCSYACHETYAAYSEACQHYSNINKAEANALKKGKSLSRGEGERSLDSIRQQRSDTSILGAVKNCILVGSILTSITAVVVFSVATFGMGIPAVSTAGVLSEHSIIAIGLVSTSVCGGAAYALYDKITLPAIRKVRKVFRLFTPEDERPPTAGSSRIDLPTIKSDIAESKKTMHMKLGKPRAGKSKHRRAVASKSSEIRSQKNGIL